jgi:prepilin-type N-terminal cleavage/methylation domain-containing protein
MRKIKEKKSGFTLMELIITVIIVGILASFVIRGFQRTVQGAKEKEAKINLLAIKTAQVIYKEKQGNYYPPSGMVNCASINTNLNLSITENPDSVQYICSYGPPPSYTCTAVYSKNGVWQWKYDIQPSWDIPVCTGGAVPCL